MPSAEELSEYALTLVRDAMDQLLAIVQGDPPSYEHFVDAEMAAMSDDGEFRSDRMAAHFLLCRAREIVHPLDDPDEGPDEDDGYRMIGLGRLDEAMAVADSLLEAAESGQAEDWNVGNLLHHGHLIRGKVALRSGRLDAAATELLAAGDVDGSPQLDSFGPDLSLAWELLRAGHDDAVIGYLRRIARFWSPSEPSAS